ncbi:MAG: two-component system sensor histidine kinase CreC [Gammaproteobacteria bacterium]|nr:MAG: two-component system sensor histidine kinase CreC [Gammaproteobacteria bacterium]
MSFNLRIFLVYFFIVGVATSLLLNVVLSELKPGIRQSTEDALVDTANLLAEIVAEDFNSSLINQENFSQSMHRFLARNHKAKISSINKSSSALRIYITNIQGIVVYDSSGLAVGQDYSQWNDVYLTLKGQYGARSTQSTPGDELSTAMYIAAPIIQNGHIVGSLTVAKPGISVQPFIDIARNKIQNRSILLVALSLIAAIALSYWLTRSIRKLVHYADEIGRGAQPPAPQLKETELAKLAGAIDNMRRQLEGKEYIEKYVYALTHELKSPISAIKGAAEIINPQMPDQDLAHFMGNIQFEVKRIDEMINRLLALASVEKQESLEHTQVVNLPDLIQEVMTSKQQHLHNKKLTLDIHLPATAQVQGDAFLLLQAVDNLLQNAIDFSLEGGKIFIQLNTENPLTLTVRDHGVGIPTYALEKLFDRFYSLARPDSHKKSSGLGLCFVAQITELHRGSINLQNNKDQGVTATLTLPHSQTT